MSDVLNNPYPVPHIDPNEPGLVAGYCFGESELAVWGRYLNHCAATGAVYDLTTRNGTPLVGQGGGIFGTAGAGWYRNAIPFVGNNFAYAIDINSFAVMSGYYVFQHRNGHGLYSGFGGTTNQAVITLDNGATTTASGYSVIGRGPYRAAILYDGTDQILGINGRVAGQTAVVPLAPAVDLRCGGTWNLQAARVYNVRRTIAQERASYVREFARQVVYSWRPNLVGEGPAGGIATGAVGEGDWYCPLGGANFKFVYVRDPRLPRGQLALNETGAAVASRLEFAHGRHPSFGSWRSGFLARTLTANPVFYLAPTRGTTYNAAASGCYWWQTSVVGGYWSLSIYRENAAVLCTYVNTSAPAQIGDVVEPSVTRHVDGRWRPWLSVNGATAGTQTTAVDVTYLWNEQIGVIPFAGYVLGLTKNQGEMEPGEFPMPIWMLR